MRTKHSRRCRFSIATQEPSDDKKVLITHNLLSVVYDAILLLQFALTATCQVIKALRVLDTVCCFISKSRLFGNILYYPLQVPE
jgi:hypothetical protein